MSATRRGGVSRRRFLGAGALGGGALLAASALGPDVLLARVAGLAPVQPVPFHGRHQAGIATPVQQRLVYAAYDVATADRTELIELLRGWTRAAARLTARDRDRLTITFGFGPSLFRREGRARFGLGRELPDALVELPGFAGDALDPARSGGDVSVQVCADDAVAAAGAARVLTRVGAGRVRPRWSQTGFAPTSTTSTEEATPRNLMGFKDGTNNITADEPAALRRDVWVGAGDGPEWMEDGSYVVVRRIRMRLDDWARTDVHEQERTVGRVKDTGAPLGQGLEHAPVDLDAAIDGEPVIPVDAHVRLAAPSENGGARLLRRGYSFDEGLDAGLFFIAYQRDPRRQFVPIQTRLADHDALNRFIEHTASAVFACPPGATRGGYVGETLFD